MPAAEMRPSEMTARSLSGGLGIPVTIEEDVPALDRAVNELGMQA
jgi:hypothetical protein